MDFPLDDLDAATRGPVARATSEHLRLVALTQNFFLDLGSVISAEYRSNGVLEIEYRVGGDSESMLFYADQAAEAWQRFRDACGRYQL